MCEVRCVWFGVLAWLCVVSDERWVDDGMVVCIVIGMMACV